MMDRRAFVVLFTGALAAPFVGIVLPEWAFNARRLSVVSTPIGTITAGQIADATITSTKMRRTFVSESTVSDHQSIVVRGRTVQLRGTTPVVIDYLKPTELYHG